jgi:hypothetical protein
METAEKLIQRLCFTLTGMFIVIAADARIDGGLYLFPEGARAVGMGNCGLLNGDVWAAYNNQAALTSLSKPEAGIYYENRFTIKQFGVSAGTFAQPALSGVFAFDVAHIGIEDYGETRIGVAYGKKLAKRLSLGVQFNYHLMNFSSGYPALNTFTGEIGLLAEPFDKVFIGAHVFNPTFAKLNSAYEDPVTVIFTLGAGYISDKLSMVAEIEKERSDRAVVRFGLEYALFRNMDFRAGAGLAPVTVCFGMGWRLGQLKIDLAFSHHETLGFSPQTGVAFKF